jgi:hypothetical protein
MIETGNPLRQWWSWPSGGSLPDDKGILTCPLDTDQHLERRFFSEMKCWPKQIAGFNVPTCYTHLHTHRHSLSLFLFMVIALSCRTRSVLPARSWQSWRVPWWFRCCHGYAAQVIRVLSCVFPPVHMKSCCCCVCSSNLILYIDILPPVWFVVSPHYLPESIRGGTLFSYSHLRNFEHQLSLAIHWRGRQALWWGVAFFRNTENHRHGKGADKGKTYDILHTRFNIHIYIYMYVYFRLFQYIHCLL